MHQRTSLASREHCFIEIELFVHLFTAHDHASPWTAQRLVGRCRRHMCIGNRTRMQTCRNKSGNMRNIHHKISADLICDLAESLKIDRPRISACSRYDQFRLIFLCDLFHFIVIDHAVFIHTVKTNLKIFPRQIHRRSVGQMSAVIQIHPHDLISRFQHRKHRRHICLRAGMRLHIDILAAK